MNLKNIFINPFGRLRSGWRFIFFLLICQFFSNLFGIIAVLTLSNPNVNLKQNIEIALTVTNSIFFVVAILTGWLCVKLFENLPFRALGFSFSDHWLKNLLFGLAYGAFAILLAAAISFVFGGINFELNRLAAPSAIWVTLGLTLVVFIVGALAEEAIFRGYALQTLTRANLAWLGIILTSILFASGHIFNPGANAFSWLNTFLAGLSFAVAYYKTRTLWLPFSYHLIWNWMQGSILGITVSGLKELTPAPLFQPVGNGISWITGGDYGIEGGFACTVALIVTTILIWFAPFLRPTKEMLNLTSHENPRLISPSES